MTRSSSKNLPGRRYVTVKPVGYCGRVVSGDKMASPVANEPFFRIDDGPRDGITARRERRTTSEDLKPGSVARAARSYGNFQASGFPGKFMAGSQLGSP